MQIIFEFDIRTIAVFVGLTFIVQATVIGAQAYLIRELKQYRGVVAALLANLCVAVGLILRLFAEQLPEFLPVIVSNTLTLAAPALFYIAISQFTEFPYSKAYVIAVIGIVLSTLVYFTYWDDDMGNRIISLAIGSIALTVIMIHQLLRVRESPLRFSANMMLVAFLLYGMALLTRTISLLRNPPQDTLSLSPVQSATYLLAFALSFYWSMSFILMVSQRLRNDLMEIATIDVLTRIPNRRATQAFLEKELSRIQRNHGEFTAFLIDIDNFKKVNDRWGHSVGDSVLVKTAGIFQSLIRKQDLVGRWGGEEFLVIVPGPCKPEALAERIRLEIANSTYSHGSGSFGITVSMGVACAGPSDQIDQVLKKTDQALYKAKLTKNTVSIAIDEA